MVDTVELSTALTMLDPAFIQSSDGTLMKIGGADATVSDAAQNVRLLGGNDDGELGPGGYIQLYAGYAGGANGGGQLELIGGDANGSGSGGQVTIQGGGTYGAGGAGNVTISGGAGQNAGPGGPVYINGGSGLSGNAGHVHINGGISSGGTAGLIILGDQVALPTADPHVAGALWNSTGTLKISAG